MKTELKIHDLRLLVHLGCTESEQAVPQEVSFSIKIYFPSPPKGQFTDQLKDTVCYAQVCQLIQEQVHHQSFHLIESLSHQVLKALNNKFPSCPIQLDTWKVKPPVEWLKGGVTYTCETVFP